MNILFYIEPNIEFEDPLLHTPWWGFTYELMLTLLNDSANEYEFLVLTNEAIKDFIDTKYPGNTFKVRSVPQEKLLARFNLDYLQASNAWYRGDFNQEQLEYSVALMKEIAGNFIPDAIITFSPVPFLHTAFPDAVVLHYEMGMVSRAPFPMTVYLDPEGMFRNNFLIKNQDEITNFRIEPQQQEFLDKYRNFYCSLIEEKNPFLAFLEMVHHRHEKIILLPLQFSRVYSFDANTEFTSQLQYLLYVLSNVPSGIGVIVTSHTVHPFLTPKLVAYIKNKYDNFYYPTDSEAFCDVSQYFLGHVDGVISVSSAVGLQTLIWRKKLIVLGNSHLNLVADATNLDDIDQLLSSPATDRDGLLYWLLTRYYIPAKYLYQPEWLAARLNKAVTLHREGKGFRDLFIPIDDEAKFFEILISSGNINIPIKIGSLTDVRWRANQELEIRRDKVTKALQFADQATADGEYHYAIKILGRCAEEYPDEKGIYPLMAVLYGQMKDFESAEMALLLALSQDPFNVSLLNQLGVVRFCMEKFKDSYATFQKALELEPNNQEIQQNLRMLDTTL